MNEYFLRFIWGIVSVLLYLFVIWVLVFYFNTTHEKKPVHFVKKNENSIVVPMITSPTKKTSKPHVKPKPKKVVKKEVVNKPVKKEIIKKKVEKKKVVKKKAEKKKVIKKVVKPKPKPKPKPKKAKKEKVVKKIKKPKMVKKDVKKPKKILKTNDLFSKVKTEKKETKPLKKVPAVPVVKANELMSKLDVAKKTDKGIENAYLAKIEEKLNGWSSQSEYAGQEAKVWFKVQPNGSFSYKVISSSGTEGFIEGLNTYLKQLQNFGFGRHKAKRAYEINVEFKATQ